MKLHLILKSPLPVKLSKLIMNGNLATVPLVRKKNPTHLFVGDQEFFEVKLNVKTSKGCESNIENRIYIKSETTTDFLITQTQRSLAFEPDVKDIAPQNYLWEFAER